MIQRHKILINPTFSGKTETVNSSLTTVGGYQVNNVQGLGGGIVNSSNVRGFLNDDVNEFIINDFFSYLTGSTTTVEFAEIYHSDQKLADIFNNYYVSSVLNNQTPSTAVLDYNLTGTTGTTIIENSIYNYDGIAPYRGLNYIPLSIDESSRKLNIYSALTTYTNEDSYYVPVFIIRNSKQMARLNFKQQEQIINLILSPTGNTLVEEEINQPTSNSSSSSYSEYSSYSSYDYNSISNSNLSTSLPPDYGTPSNLDGNSIFDQFLKQ